MRGKSSHHHTRSGLVLLFMLVIIASACRSMHPSSPAKRSAPLAFDIAGNPVFLDHSEKQKTVLLFWATWCPMCKEGLQALNALAPELKKHEIEIIAVGLDEEPEAIRTATQSLRLSYPVVMDSERSLRSRYQVGMVPVVLAVDAKGNIQPLRDPKTSEVSRHIEGYRDWASPEGQKALFGLETFGR